MKTKVLLNTILSGAVVLAAALVSNGGHTILPATSLSSRSINRHPVAVVVVPSPAPSTQACPLSFAEDGGQIGLLLTDDPFSAGLERTFSA